GLSSSAALEVAIALALCAVAGFELEPLELALAYRRAELRAVGVPCGILDQAACVLGRPALSLGSSSAAVVKGWPRGAAGSKLPGGRSRISRETRKERWSRW